MKSREIAPLQEGGVADDQACCGLVGAQHEAGLPFPLIADPARVLYAAWRRAPAEFAGSPRALGAAIAGQAAELRNHSTSAARSDRSSPPEVALGCQQIF